ncbi:MAG TPA: gamma-glutamyl-gamma-aminobutyrate hydrolase family protein [Bryobacteraceae bacterium]|nr:gamma-glutamyl-gamma-aminobutyrate hydrolase family protein [Bryobacteraceae bacterium]
MRVLVFRHSPSDGLGLIGGALDAHAIPYAYADLYATPGTVAPANEADALIVLGGSMSANDTLTFITREIDYVRNAIERGKPVLGVCLGAQLIAKALGARVYANDVKEVGWAPVTFNDAALQDPLFAGLRQDQIIFHWHGETFDLPSGAELLASSAACRNQAFRVGDRIYGLQFHLEVTPDMILEWCQEDAACAANVRPSIDPHAHLASTKQLAEKVFSRWCRLVKGQIAACGVSC